MVTTLTDQPMQEEQLETFFLMHRSMRQDAAALVVAVEHLDSADRGASRALAAWFEAFRAGIVHHHTVEDDIFWPALAQRSEEFRRAAEQLEEDHHRLDEVMEQVASSLAGHGDVRAAAGAFAEVLGAHLDREEAAAIPAMLTCLPAAEYDALHEQATKQDGLRGLAWVLPWLVDHCTPEEVASGLAKLPAPVRWMNTLLWTRRYQRLAAPVRAARGLPRTRRPRGRRALVSGAPVVILVALVAGLFVGCGGEDADAAGGPTAVPAGPPASDVTLTATEYTFESSAQRIAAGRVRLTLDNKGKEPHQVQLGLVEPGTTVDSFVETFHEKGSGAAEKLIRWQTGVNGVEPGARGSVVGDLEPGRYLMVCFVPGHDGVSHIDKEMVVPIEVVPGGRPVDEPDAEGEIVIKDYAIDIAGSFDGQGTFAVRNAGPADHELILMRYKDGKSLADLVAWSEAGTKGTPPVIYSGGVGTIPRGETSWVDLDLPPGRYIALCVITGPGGQPHALMGMTREFEIR